MGILKRSTSIDKLSSAGKAEITTRIEPKSGWQGIDFRELWDYRDLLYFSVWRDIKSRYAQSALGIGWAVIQPVFFMIVFTLVFGELANIDSDGAPYAIFSYAGLVPWVYFSGALVDTTGSLLKGSSLLTKVYFPRLIMPISSAVAKLVDFFIAFLLVFILMAWFKSPPTIWILALPLLILIMVLAAAGIGTWLTSLAVQYRDIAYASPFAIQLLMFASPVVYPASLVPERFQLVYALNPMVGVIEGFRSALLGTNPMPWDLIGVGGAVASVVAISGALFFHRKERVFADVV